MLQFARKTSKSAAAFWIFDLSMIFSENRYTLFPDHALASAKLRCDRVHGLREIDIARGHAARIMR